MTDFCKQLEDAAKLTQKIVNTMKWLERKGPDNSKCLVRDMENVIKAINADYKEDEEQRKILAIHQSVQMARTRLFEYEKELYLRLAVLDALNKSAELK